MSMFSPSVLARKLGSVAALKVSGSSSIAWTSAQRVTNHIWSAGIQATGSSSRRRARMGSGSRSSSSAVTVAARLKGRLPS